MKKTNSNSRVRLCERKRSSHAYAIRPNARFIAMDATATSATGPAKSGRALTIPTQNAKCQTIAVSESGSARAYAIFSAKNEENRDGNRSNPLESKLVASCVER